MTALSPVDEPECHPLLAGKIPGRSRRLRLVNSRIQELKTTSSEHSNKLLKYLRVEIDASKSLNLFSRHVLNDLDGSNKTCRSAQQISNIHASTAASNSIPSKFKSRRFGSEIRFLKGSAKIGEILAFSTTIEKRCPDRHKSFTECSEYRATRSSC
jgi:hypothetical protein